MDHCIERVVNVWIHFIFIRFTCVYVVCVSISIVQMFYFFIFFLQIIRHHESFFWWGGWNDRLIEFVVVVFLIFFSFEISNVFIHSKSHYIFFWDKLIHRGIVEKQIFFFSFKENNNNKLLCLCVCLLFSSIKYLKGNRPELQEFFFSSTFFYVCFPKQPPPFITFIINPSIECENLISTEKKNPFDQ